jgi:hypothetical protein
MPDPTEHACLSCKFSKWKRTKTGNLHPSGEGRCTWEGWKHFTLPKCMNYTYYYGSSCPPRPNGGYINRKEPISSCPCREEF